MNKKRIFIKLTQNNFNQKSVRIPRGLETFFPPESISRERKPKVGLELSLHCAGLRKPVVTDIYQDGSKTLFRTRSIKTWGRFFDIHNLQPGDSVIVEKIPGTKTEFSVYPQRQP